MCGCVNAQNVISRSADPVCGQRRRGRTEAEKKNNVSENWTELVKILVVVWKLPGLRDPITGSIHVIPFRREPPLRA